jgi:hypothetical protein
MVEDIELGALDVKLDDRDFAVRDLGEDARGGADLNRLPAAAPLPRRPSKIVPCGPRRGRRCSPG